MAVFSLVSFQSCEFGQQHAWASHGAIRIALTECSAFAQALGVEVDIGPQSVARCVEEAGVGFMYAPR